MAIAPWLQLPNFVGAAEAGSQQQDTHAQLALQQQKQQQDAAQQGAELALRRDEMMLNAQHQADALRAQQEQTKAVQALHQQQLAQQLGLGQERIGVEQAGLGERQSAADQLNAYRQATLDARLGAAESKQPKLSPQDEDSVKTVDERLGELQKNMDALRFSDNPDQDQMMKLQGAINDLGRQKQSIFSKYSQASLPSTPATTPQSTPATAALTAQPSGFIGKPGGQNNFSPSLPNFVGTPGGENKFIQPATTALSPSGQGKAQPVPSDPSKLVVGQSYISPSGKVGTWNGNGFSTQ